MCAQEVVSFVVPLPPVALRRNRQTRVHNYRARLVREYQEQVWVSGAAAFSERWPIFVGPPHNRTVNPESPKMPWERARVHYEWRSTHETDADNIIATMKPALDVIKSTGPRPLGIIRDDGPGVEVTATWVKAKRADQCVLIRIERLEARA